VNGTYNGFVESPAVVQSLHGNEFDTVLGRISFDAKGDLTVQNWVWYVWRGGSSSWGVMRGYLNNMMEDLGNQDQLQPYADYALHAGATVVSMRPLGQQVQEVVVDNSDAGFSVASGSWSNSTAAPYWSNNNGNDCINNANTCNQRSC